MTTTDSSAEAAPAPKKSRKKLYLAIALAVVVVKVLAFGVFGVQSAFYDVTVNQPMDMATAGQAVVSGQFHDVLHAGTGNATVYMGDDGKFKLRLDDLKVDNGPALHVVLIAAPDAKDSDTVKSSGFLDLGPLAGNIGSQTYTIPDGFNAAKHRSVSIWCERFSVNFATAPLTPVAAATP